MTWYIPLLLAQVLDVGSTKQLFIDHRFFEMVEGVTLTVNPARPTGEKVLVPDAPWEKDAKIGSYCTVVDEGGKRLGAVDGFFATGGSSVMVVKGGKERLIPFVPAYVVSVDREAGRIVVDWKPEYDA